MYLSKVFITWRTARNPYDIHSALWQLFPDRPNDDRDFLFRVEKTVKNVGSDILMQSVRQPISDHPEIRISAWRHYELSLKQGQNLRFRLRANPTKKITDASGRLTRKSEPKKCRVPLVKEEDQRRWLERKVEAVCLLQSLIIQREMPLFFYKESEKRTGKIQPVLYDGILTIKDTDGFIRELGKGIGPGKAFGCGLISLAPA